MLVTEEKVSQTVFTCFQTDSQIFVFTFFYFNQTTANTREQRQSILFMSGTRSGQVTAAALGM